MAQITLILLPLAILTAIVLPSKIDDLLSGNSGTARRALSR